MNNTKKNKSVKVIKNPEEETTGSTQELHSIFKTCLDILRNDAEHLIGDEALNELSHFLILKQTEKHIENGNIDIYNLELYKDGLNKYGKDKFLEYLEYIKFSKLVEYVKIPEKEDNIKKVFDDFIWKEVLSKHPKFKDVFEDGKKSFIKESITIKKIIIALSTINFDNFDYDILGEAYESIFVDAVFGAGGNKKSELGQFFTPPKVKKLLVKLVNPKLKDNGEIESVLDPASGTGGILNTIIKYYKKFKINSEDLRKQLIKNVYGMEIKGKIYNLCLSNMLINTGEILPNVICTDSIRNFHNIKVDNIVANPPFSITINYDELLSNLGSLDILNDYIPIKAGGKNSEVLFLQMMIHCLNIGGSCVTVMLDGQKIYGDSAGYSEVREYLMKSCDLEKVILCPPGTFTSTASKTCILNFTKKKERKDVVQIAENKKRTLTFTKDHVTKIVKFYNYIIDDGSISFIKDVSIENIAKNNYSLNPDDYDKVIKKNLKIEGIEWKMLGDVCELQNGYAFKSLDFENEHDNDNNIGILQIKSIQDNTISYEKITEYVPENDKYKKFEIIKNDIIIALSGATTGKLGLYQLNYKSYINQRVAKIKCVNIENMYFYYWYLISGISNKILNMAKGTAQPNISTNDIAKLSIPIPSLEKQKIIITFLDKIFEKTDIKNISEYFNNSDIFKLLLDEKYELFEKLVEWYEQSNELNSHIDFIKKRQQRYLYLMGEGSDNEIKTLGDVFIQVKIGKDVVSTNREKGEYPFYGANGIIDYVNDYIFDGKYLLTARTGSLGSLHISNGKFWCSGDVHVMTFDNDITLLYIYYYLHIINFQKFRTGAVYPKLNTVNLKSIEIPVPPLEKQQEIINYCENNDKLIKQLEQEIELNKILANDFLSNIIKSKEETDINSDTENLITENIRIEIEEKEEVLINKIATVSKVKKSTKTK